MAVEIRDNGNYHALLCDDCGTEIFCDLNMVMVNDALWKKVAGKKHNDPDCAYCADCMEKRLGREITPKDFREPGTFCNEMWLLYRVH